MVGLVAVFRVVGAGGEASGEIFAFVDVKGDESGGCHGAVAPFFGI